MKKVCFKMLVFTAGSIVWRSETKLVKTKLVNNLVAIKLNIYFIVLLICSVVSLFSGGIFFYCDHYTKFEINVE